MNEKLKKKLTSNWFKILQESICDDIEKIEGKKKYIIQIAGKEIKIEMKVVVNLEYLKMEKFLTKLELIFLKSMENYQNNLRTRFLELTRVQNFGPQASRL